MSTQCRFVITSTLVLAVILGHSVVRAAEEDAGPKPQYEHETILISAASGEEGRRDVHSADIADRYLRDGAVAWSRARKCVTCHTNGAYLAIRPALTPQLGPPADEVRDLFVEKVGKHNELPQDKLTSGVRPTEIAYLALGLAEWDACVTQKLSPQTDDALRLMFRAQSEDGSWRNQACWPPFESSNFQSTTIAATAAATAPGWMVEDDEISARIDKMTDYLRNTVPPHDYARVLLLWTATRMPGLLENSRIEEIIELIKRHQREDGGWSIRTFATPEKWGGGNRAEKLRAEPEFADPPSDGHMTGLAVVVLRDAGVPVDDPQIRAAVEWLSSNQRESGRWWTRSLNTDNYHFITFSGTAYALLALSKCDAL